MFEISTGMNIYRIQMLNSAVRSEHLAIMEFCSYNSKETSVNIQTAYYYPNISFCLRQGPFLAKQLLNRSTITGEDTKSLQQFL
jgi:hypothetical protein